MGFQQMTAMRSAVGLGDDDMGMQLRPLLAQRDIADQGYDLDLLFDGDVFVILFLPVEEAQNNIAESADSRDLAGAKVLLFCESREGVDRLVALVQDDGKGALRPVMNEFRSHFTVLPGYARAADRALAGEPPPNAALDDWCHGRSVRGS